MARNEFDPKSAEAIAVRDFLAANWTAFTCHCAAYDLESDDVFVYLGGDQADTETS